jgi:glutathione S-transferase
VRTVGFSVFLEEPDYLCAIFTRGQPAWKRASYRVLVPFAKPLMARANGVNTENVPRAFARTERALDDTARAIGTTGQLVGDRFSVADLTAAALLAPLAALSHPDMARPHRVPARAQELYARFDRHPALQWVREQYARHRPAP